MVIVDKATRDFARNLARLSVENGLVSDARVEAVLQAVRSRPRRQLRPLLKSYLFYIGREIARSQAVVEYAGEITPERVSDIERSLSHRYGRAIAALTRENADLIAGLCIKVGDDVRDSSIKGRLARLAQAAGG